MSYYSDDPIRDFDAWDREQNRRLRTRPICRECRAPIQEEIAYYNGSDWICEDCFGAYRREVVDCG